MWLCDGAPVSERRSWTPPVRPAKSLQLFVSLSLSVCNHQTWNCIAKKKEPTPVLLKGPSPLAGRRLDRTRTMRRCPQPTTPEAPFWKVPSTAAVPATWHRCFSIDINLIMYQTDRRHAGITNRWVALTSFHACAVTQGDFFFFLLLWDRPLGPPVPQPPLGAAAACNVSFNCTPRLLIFCADNRCPFEEAWFIRFS